MPSKPQYRNRAAIRSGKYTGAHLQEALDDLQAQIVRMARQGNLNPIGQVQAPAQISGLTVTGGGGIHRIAIQDSNPIDRGTNYHIEWDTSPQFPSPKQITLGPDKNRELSLGVSGQVYFRAYSSKPTSEPSQPVYFGTQANPAGVDAGTITVKVPGVTAGAVTITTSFAPQGPAVLPNAGAGTEPSLLPRGSPGFGFDPIRQSQLDRE